MGAVGLAMTGLQALAIVFIKADARVGFVKKASMPRSVMLDISSLLLTDDSIIAGISCDRFASEMFKLFR